MEEKRNSIRFTTNLNARYFSGESKGNGKKCTVINISRNGTGLKFCTPEKFGIGSNLMLEIFVPNATDPINVKGIVRWIREGEKHFIGGVEVTLKSDNEKLADLIKFTVGI